VPARMRETLSGWLRQETAGGVFCQQGGASVFWVEAAKQSGT